MEHLVANRFKFIVTFRTSYTVHTTYPIRGWHVVFLLAVSNQDLSVGNYNLT